MRLVKERDADQALWENLNVDLVDTKDYLDHVKQLQGQAREDYAERQHMLGEARALELQADEDLEAAKLLEFRARERQKGARELRIEAQRQESASHKRLDATDKLVHAVETHVIRDRKALVDWAVGKGFQDDMLPELQLFAKGGLKQLVQSHRLKHAGVTPREAEAI